MQERRDRHREEGLPRIGEAALVQMVNVRDGEVEWRKEYDAGGPERRIRQRRVRKSKESKRYEKRTELKLFR
jgi:hypothetical protein